MNNIKTVEEFGEALAETIATVNDEPLMKAEAKEIYQGIIDAICRLKGGYRNKIMACELHIQWLREDESASKFIWQECVQNLRAAKIWLKYKKEVNESIEVEVATIAYEKNRCKQLLDWCKLIGDKLFVEHWGVAVAEINLKKMELISDKMVESMQTDTCFDADIIEEFMETLRRNG